MRKCGGMHKVHWGHAGVRICRRMHMVFDKAGKGNAREKIEMPYHNGRCKNYRKDRSGDIDTIRGAGSGQGGRDELTFPTKGNLWIDDKLVVKMEDAAVVGGMCLEREKTATG